MQTLSQVIPDSQTVIEMACSRCQHPRSRRNGIVVEISGRSRFLCAVCLDYLERVAQRDFVRAGLGGVA